MRQDFFLWLNRRPMQGWKGGMRTRYLRLVEAKPIEMIQRCLISSILRKHVDSGRVTGLERYEFNCNGLLYGM